LLERRHQAGQVVGRNLAVAVEVDDNLGLGVGLVGVASQPDRP
jgi:hypothetical protein